MNQISMTTETFKTNIAASRPSASIEATFRKKYDEASIEETEATAPEKTKEIDEDVVCDYLILQPFIQQKIHTSAHSGKQASLRLGEGVQAFDGILPQPETVDGSKGYANQGKEGKFLLAGEVGADDLSKQRRELAITGLKTDSEKINNLLVGNKLPVEGAPVLPGKNNGQQLSALNTGSRYDGSKNPPIAESGNALIVENDMTGSERIPDHIQPNQKKVAIKEDAAGMETGKQATSTVSVNQNTTSAQEGAPTKNDPSNMLRKLFSSLENQVPLGANDKSEGFRYEFTHLRGHNNGVASVHVKTSQESGGVVQLTPSDAYVSDKLQKVMMNSPVDVVMSSEDYSQNPEHEDRGQHRDKGHRNLNELVDEEES